MFFLLIAGEMSGEMSLLNRGEKSEGLNVRGEMSGRKMSGGKCPVSLIDTQQLYLLLLTETNIAHDAPAAIRDDVAPCWF